MIFQMHEVPHFMMVIPTHINEVPNMGFALRYMLCVQRTVRDSALKKLIICVGIKTNTQM